MSNGLRRLLVVASIAISSVGLVSAGCSGGDTATDPGSTDPAVSSGDLNVEIIDRVPHDTNAFTQGFFFDDEGRLFEGTGLEGESSIRFRMYPDGVRQLLEGWTKNFAAGAGNNPDGNVGQRSCVWRSISHRRYFNTRPGKPRTFNPTRRFSTDGMLMLFTACASVGSSPARQNL